jgi:hypothetical protein
VFLVIFGNTADIFLNGTDKMKMRAPLLLTLTAGAAHCGSGALSSECRYENQQHFLHKINLWELRVRALRNLKTNCRFFSA